MGDDDDESWDATPSTGSGAGGTPGTGSAAAPAATTAGTGAATGSEGSIPDISEYDLEATFRYSYSVGPSRFDPHKATSSFDNTSLYLTYDRLVHQSPEASAIPGLATEWEFSPDGFDARLHAP